MQGRRLGVKDLGLEVLVCYCFMESTSHNLTGAKSVNETTLTNAKVSRGISLRACVAKAAGWTLEKANALPMQEASINKTS